uniref:Uncharacterized protein n=1 Tax=Arundo donax TaxID=35708 RepID=A0A0A8Z0P0_ARUDO
MDPDSNSNSKKISPGPIIRHFNPTKISHRH